MCLAEVTIARQEDFGVNDIQFTVLTHLGNQIDVGDTVLGYDLLQQNLTEDVFTSTNRNLPDVILIRRIYPKIHKRSERRIWKLRHLDKNTIDTIQKYRSSIKRSELDKDEQEYEEFLQDIEEDPELRSKINLYKRDDISKDIDTIVDDSNDKLPVIEIDELLDSFEKVNITQTTGDDMDVESNNSVPLECGNDDDNSLYDTIPQFKLNIDNTERSTQN